jgi:hypothetical protein
MEGVLVSYLSARSSTCRSLYTKIQKLKDKIKACGLRHWTRRVQLASEETSSPFMDLPVELRQLIYSYLIPNTTVTNRGRFDAWESLRHDGEPCCPAMLRTNQKIYHEMIELFYSSSYFCILLSKNTLRFTSRGFKSVSRLPFSFRFITGLSLTLRVAGRSLDDIREREKFGFVSVKEAREQLRLINEIAIFFSPSGPGSLRNLKFDFRFCPMFFPGLSNISKTTVDRQATTHESLEFNFHSLRKIRVSGEVSMHEFEPQRACVRCFGEVKGDVITETREYFDLLGKEISGAYDKQDCDGVADIRHLVQFTDFPALVRLP